MEFKREKSIDLLFFCCLLAAQTRTILEVAFAGKLPLSKKVGNKMRERKDRNGIYVMDFFGMLCYYGGDENSKSRLRFFPISKCAVVPDIRIAVKKLNARSARIEWVYPFFRIRKQIELGPRGIAALRRLGQKNRGGWETVEVGEEIQFYKLGKLVGPGELAPDDISCKDTQGV